jgi:hypothetical protein
MVIQDARQALLTAEITSASAIPPAAFISWPF